MTITLQIGGYRIRLNEPEGQVCGKWPLYPYDSFLGPAEAPADITLTVHVVRRLPDLRHGALRFDTGEGFWKLYEAGAENVMECLDPKTRIVRSRTVLSLDFSQGEVWICGTASNQKGKLNWKPQYVLNPIAEVCLVTRLALDGGFLLHAAGILTKHGGWVFTGPSGAGKSTISDYFAARGASVLSDERVIIRMIDRELQLFGTPWPGAGRLAKNDHAPLTALHCIAHGQGSHLLRPMDPRSVSPFVLPQTFLPHWDRTAMDRTLETLDTLIGHIGTFDLSFIQDVNVVDFLHEQHFATAAT